MINIRKIVKAEIKEVVSIHQVAFKDFFLTSLGTRFLRLYYKTALYEDTAVLLGAFDDDDKLLGFVLGTSQAKGFHKRLLINNLFQYCLMGIYLISTKPKALRRLAANMEKVGIVDDDKNYAELLSIGVANSGKGVGMQLLICFENELKKAYCNKVALTTDSDNNERALSFYKKMNYLEYYTFITYPDRRMFKLIKELK